MICPYCKHKVIGNFCSWCGAPAPTMNSQNTANPNTDPSQNTQNTQTDPNSNPQNPNYQTYQAPNSNFNPQGNPYQQPYGYQPGYQAPYYGAPAPKKKHTGLIITGIVLAVILVCSGFAVGVSALVGHFVNRSAPSAEDLLPGFSDGEEITPSDPGSSDEYGNSFGSGDSGSSDAFGNENGSTYNKNQVPSSYQETEGTYKGCTVYPEGTYAVGTDIPAGDYLLVSTSSSDSSLIYAYYSDDGSFTSSTANYYFANRGYVTLNAGTYVMLDGCEAISVDEAPAYTAENDEYASGMYLVGKDLKAGTYFLYGDEFNAYIYDSPTVTSSDDVLGGTMENQGYVTLKDGQYFEMMGGSFKALDKAGDSTVSGSTIKSGMYLVGRDLDAGTYTMLAESSSGYCSILSDCTFADSSIEESYQAGGAQTITLEKGDYVFLSEMELTPAD